MGKGWSEARAEEHIEARLADVEKVEVVEYTRDASLSNIARNKAYRVHGVHLYADILNVPDMLAVTQVEGETCHRRTLRFLNLHYRAVDRILARASARFVDFHGQRLHALIAKPYDTQVGAERSRVERAVAIGDMIERTLSEIADDDEQIPPAEVRIGIDTGDALAVNNGRAGGREPLFLGRPANHAAKLSGGGSKTGIFLTNEARLAIGLAEVTNPKTVALSRSEIDACVDAADLDFDVDDIVQEWREDLDASPIGSFSFSAHTPPLRTLDISVLTPANSRRQDAVSIFADIDGFTDYVARNIDDRPEDVVRALHVVRAELDRVLTAEFDGRRIRHIGDCIHGLLAEGTAAATEAEATIDTAALCAGALRSSFAKSLELLDGAGIDVAGLDLAIGFEFGPMTVTRLGMKGRRVRCSISRGVLASEDEQKRCNADETAIGPIAYGEAGEAVRLLFQEGRLADGLDYAAVADALTAKAAAKSDARVLRPATRPAAAAAPLGFPAVAATPAKPAGFA
jgi:class 3 adenylate cyclase